MNENINSDVTSKHINQQSGFKQIDDNNKNNNKNFNFLLEVTGVNTVPTRTPLKDKFFNFNANNSKTPIHKNPPLNSQIILYEKQQLNQQEVKIKKNIVNLKENLFQNLTAGEAKIESNDLILNQRSLVDSNIDNSTNKLLE
jgi:hypothetical protein